VESRRKREIEEVKRAREVEVRASGNEARRQADKARDEKVNLMREEEAIAARRQDTTADRAGKQLLKSSHVQKALVGKSLRIPLNLKTEMKTIKVKISQQGIYIGDAQIQERNFGEYLIVWTANQSGEYTMEIMVQGETKHVVHIQAENSNFSHNGPREVTTFVGYEVEKVKSHSSHTSNT